MEREEELWWDFEKNAYGKAVPRRKDSDIFRILAASIRERERDDRMVPLLFHRHHNTFALRDVA